MFSLEKFTQRIGVERRGCLLNLAKKCPQLLEELLTQGDDNYKFDLLLTIVENDPLGLKTLLFPPQGFNVPSPLRSYCFDVRILQAAVETNPFLLVDNRFYDKYGGPLCDDERSVLMTLLLPQYPWLLYDRRRIAKNVEQKHFYWHAEDYSYMNICIVMNQGMHSDLEMLFNVLLAEEASVGTTLFKHNFSDRQQESILLKLIEADYAYIFCTFPKKFLTDITDKVKRAALQAHPPVASICSEIQCQAMTVENTLNWLHNTPNMWESWNEDEHLEKLLRHDKEKYNLAVKKFRDIEREYCSVMHNAPWDMWQLNKNSDYEELCNDKADCDAHFKMCNEYILKVQARFIFHERQSKVQACVVQSVWV
jgi:hypothetical protein